MQETSSPKRSQLLFRLRNLLTGGSSAPSEDLAQKRATLAHHAATRAVGEAMATVGILSSQYRCKVLSTLGSQARLALVVNVLEGPTLTAVQQGLLERKIAAAAAARVPVEVIAVYWRWEQTAAEPVKPPPIPEAIRKAQAFALAERAMQSRDSEWPSTVMEYGPQPEASNSDLMPLL